MNNNVISGNLGYKGPKGEDGVSPTLSVTKESGVATITITDAEGTKSVQLSDGELTKAMVIDNLTSTLTDQPLSAKQGKMLNDALSNQVEQMENEINGTVLYSNESLIPYKDISSREITANFKNFEKIKIIYGAKIGHPYSSSFIIDFNVSSANFCPIEFEDSVSSHLISSSTILNLETAKYIVEQGDTTDTPVFNGINKLNVRFSLYKAYNQNKYYFSLGDYTLNGSYVSSMDSCPIIVYKIIGYNY